MRRSQSEFQGTERDSPGSAAYSPAFPLEEPPVYVTRSEAVHRYPANGQTGDWTGPYVTPGSLLPPKPDVGGEAGRVQQLGWTYGILHDRSMHKALSGMTLVRPSMGAHPAYGPVGYSTRSQRLANGVEALFTDYTPDAQTVARRMVGAGAV